MARHHDVLTLLPDDLLPSQRCAAFYQSSFASRRNQLLAVSFLIEAPILKAGRLELLCGDGFAALVSRKEFKVRFANSSGSFLGVSFHRQQHHRIREKLVKHGAHETTDGDVCKLAFDRGSNVINELIFKDNIRKNQFDNSYPAGGTTKGQGPGQKKDEHLWCTLDCTRVYKKIWARYISFLFGKEYIGHLYSISYQQHEDVWGFMHELNEQGLLLWTLQDFNAH